MEAKNNPLWNIECWEVNVLERSERMITMDRPTFWYIVQDILLVVLHQRTRSELLDHGLGLNVEGSQLAYLCSVAKAFLERIESVT